LLCHLSYGLTPLFFSIGIDFWGFLKKPLDNRYDNRYHKKVEIDNRRPTTGGCRDPTKHVERERLNHDSDYRKSRGRTQAF